MAKAGRIPYTDAISAVSIPKKWAGAPSLIWKEKGGKGFPAAYNLRIPLEVNGVVQEGYFLDLYFKFSDLEDVPHKVSMAFVASDARLVALDENGPTQHINSVGIGLPFHQKNATHPHLHFPVPEASSGYAEPIDRVDLQSLWRIFLERANISGAPPFSLPPRQPRDDSGQMELL